MRVEEREREAVVWRAGEREAVVGRVEKELGRGESGGEKSVVERGESGGVGGSCSR